MKLDQQAVPAQLVPSTPTGATLDPVYPESDLARAACHTVHTAPQLLWDPPVGIQLVGAFLRFACPAAAGLNYEIVNEHGETIAKDYY